MSFQPKPPQTLLMLSLVFGPREPKLGDLRPKLEPSALRKELETEGLIRVEKRGRSSYVVLTDKGWQWTQEHMDRPINPQGTNPGRVLLDLLPRLKSFLERKNHALAELFEDEQQREVGREVASSSERQARDALLSLGGGHTQQRLTLAQARVALPGLSRTEFDEVLLRLQDRRTVALYHEDNPELRSPDVEAAAIGVANSRYHIVYLLN